MAKKISSSDIAEDDLFGKIRESAEETITIIDKLSKSLIETAEAVKKSVGGAKFDSTKSIDNFVKATKQANDLQKQSIKLEQEKARATEMRSKAMAAQQKRMQEVEKSEQQRKKTTQESLKVEGEKERLAQQRIRTAEQQAKADERAARAIERERTALKNTAPAYKELSDKARELKNQSKELAAQMIKLEAEGKRNSTEYRSLARSYDDVTGKAKLMDQQLKDIDSTVGDNFRNVGNYKDALGGLNGVLGTLGVAFGVTEVVGGIFNINKELDKATNTARMFFKESEEGTKALAQEAITLGKVWGKDTNEVLSAANVLTKEFGISGEEALQRINTGFNKGADVQGEFIDNIKEYSSQLSYAGLTAEQTIALITQSQEQGVFSDKGVDSIKEAALSLREMTDPAKDALAAIGMSGEELQAQIQSGQLTYFEAIQKISAKTAEFGQGSQEAGMILADVFKGAGEDAGRFIFSLDEMNLNLDEMDDTSQGLDSALGNLTAKFYDFIFGVNDSVGVTDAFVTSINFLANNLGTILGVIGRIVAAYVTYKAIQQSLLVIEKMRALSLVDFGKKLAAQIPMTRAYRLEQVKAARAAQQGGEAVKTAGKAMSAVPWMLIIGAVIELAMSFYDAASGAAELRRQQELNEAFEQAASDRANQRVTDRTQSLDKELAALQRKQQEELAAAKTDKERAALDKKFAQQREQNVANTQKQVKADIAAVEGRKKAYKQDLAQLELLQKQHDATSDRSKQGEIFVKQMEMAGKIAKKYGVEGDDSKLFGFIPIGGKDTANATEVVRGLTARIEAANEKLEIYGQELSTVSERTKDAASEVKVLNIQEADNSGKISAKIPKMKEVNVELAQQINLIKELNDVNADLISTEEEINQFLAERQAQGLERQFEDEREKQIEHTKKTGEIDKANLERMVDDRAAILRVAARERADSEIAELKRSHSLRMIELRNNLEEEYQLKISQEGITEEQKAQLKQQYTRQTAEINALEINYEKVLNQEVLKINLETQGEIDDINQDAADKKKAVNDELLDAQKTNKDLEVKTEEDGNKSIEEAAKAHVERMKELANMLTEFLVAQSDKRIARIEDEMKAAENQRDFLQDLAAEGNIQASQSLAEQNRIIAEANLKKQQEERRKQKIELANSVFQTYASKVESGSKSPLSDTIRDISLLNQFISTFTPTFKDGTENTGHIGAGVDGEGGFHAILHPHERVMTKEQNKMVGDLSNTELASLAASYQAGTVINSQGATQLGNGWNTIAVLKQLESLERTIKNKPEHRLEVENVVQGAMDIVRTTKSGGTTIYNRYRVRK